MRLLPQPGRAKDNSPAIYRWGAGVRAGISPVRDERSGLEVRGLNSGWLGCPRRIFFRSCGAWAEWIGQDPAMNRWAIFGCPWRDRSGRPGSTYRCCLATHHAQMERGLPQPDRAEDNSPPFQCWVCCLRQTRLPHAPRRFFANSFLSFSSGRVLSTSALVSHPLRATPAPSRRKPACSKRWASGLRTHLTPLPNA